VVGCDSNWIAQRLAAHWKNLRQYTPSQAVAQHDEGGRRSDGKPGKPYWQQLTLFGGGAGQIRSACPSFPRSVCRCGRPLNFTGEAVAKRWREEAPMNSDHSDRKRKIKHELREMLALFLYLAFFFCALVTYNMLLLAQYHVEYWNFAFALINAAVITKVIMIGEYAKLGRRYEDKSLLVSSVWKAFIFGLLVFAFHVAEEIIKRLIHGADITQASRGLRLEQFARAASSYSSRLFHYLHFGNSGVSWVKKNSRLWSFQAMQKP
jgi:hypothetical protein